MAPEFIFAQHVKKILNEGKREIEIPEGARISAAAADLIKDHQIQIKTIAPGPDVAADAQQPKAKPVEKVSKTLAAIQKETVSNSVKNGSQADAGSEISDEALEAIVNRVVERFKQRKGLGSSKPIKKEGVAVEQKNAPADDDDLVICRCEEITKGEIKEAIRNGMRTLNGIKRITRAGMGLCQGQTCQTLVTRLLAEELGVSPAEVEPTTARSPVRPLKLEVFANS